MRIERLMASVFVLAVFGISVSAAPGAEQLPPPTGERWALLVGINDYQALGKLDTCRADAEGLAKVLTEKCGYREDRVALLVDGAGGEEPTSAAIRRRIIQFARLAAEDDTILFFFSGHGVTREGQGYIVPLDGDAMTGIALDWVKETLLSSKAASKIMVLDACHAGSSAKGVAGIAPSLVGGSGLTMLLSSRADEVSYPDASGMSVFTKYLVEGISGPADSDGDALVTGAELFAYVSDGMKGWCVVRPHGKDAGAAVLRRRRAGRRPGASQDRPRNPRREGRYRGAHQGA